MIMEIRGHGGITYFGLKYGSRPWYGMDIFWNRPMKEINTFYANLYTSSLKATNKTFLEFTENTDLQIP